MAFQPFGRHLHNQIVIPLLVGYVGVALIATLVAVVQLRGLIDDWVGRNAGQAARGAQDRVEEVARRLQSDARLIAQEKGVASAAATQDWASLQPDLAMLRQNEDVDDVFLLDGTGVLVAKAGIAPVDLGDRPLGRLDAGASANLDYVTILRIGGVDMIAAVRGAPLRVGGQTDAFTVVTAHWITWDFLRRNFGGTAAAVGYCDGEHNLRARFVDPGAAFLSSRTTSPSDYNELKTRFRESISMANESIRDAVGHPGRAVAYTSEGRQFTVRATSAGFLTATGGTAASDATYTPAGANGHLFVVMSNAVANDAGGTATGLIAWWSLVAILALTGLGAVIARLVSSPLAALSEGARRVAEGDFSVRVEVPGANEVTDVADSFNAMTDSLRERTETLTKKVLELATLYEMSGALGSTLDLSVLLDSVLDSALRIFDVDSGYVMIRDKASGSLDLCAWRGLALGADDRAVRGSMSEWVIRQGRPLIYNPSADEQAVNHTDSVTGALAALCVPMSAAEGVLGAICVGSRDPDFRFVSDDVRLLSTIANHVTMAIGNIDLFSSLQEAYLATVRALAAAVDAKDPYTRGHSDRVAVYAKAMAEALDLSIDQTTALEMAAYLHDIGKIGVRETILLKPGKLDDEEMTQMRHHPLIGASILRPVAFPWPIAPVVRHHHEHYDGRGYPAGLKGEEIPVLARVLTVADAYEAMTSDRPYRRGCTRQEALDELERCRGTHFDPKIIDAFLGVLSEPDRIPAVSENGHKGDVQPEEARAVFVSVCDGMLASFRRLGGPRLASNFESSLDAFFTERSTPCRLRNGHMSVEWGDGGDMDSEIEDMRAVVTKLAAGMEAVAGRSLVDHFYEEAVAEMSGRMAVIAEELDLYVQD